MKIVILTCEKYYDTRMKIILNTWGKNQELYLLTDFSRECEANEDSRSTTFVNFPEADPQYNSLWQRYFLFLKNYDITDESEWYLFCDDDTFVNIKTLENIVKKWKFDEPVCIGNILKLDERCNDRDGNYTGFPLGSLAGKNCSLPLEYPSGGSGFLLNKISMKNLMNYIRDTKLHEVARGYNSDVSIGFWLREINTKLVNVRGFWPTTPQKLFHTEEIIKQSYTYHYVDEELTLKLQKILLEQN